MDLRKSNRYDIAFRMGIGRRDSQQDAGFVAACDNETLAVVCDGMGGLTGGERASRAAIEKFLSEYEREGRLDGGEWMEEAIELTDDLVYSLKAPDGTPLGAGTTLAAVHIIADRMYWVSAGDSRIYVLRAGQMVQITTDHNYFFQLNEMLQNGEIDREQYRIEAQEGEALISYVGMGGLQWKDISRAPFVLRPKDTILICSDGLYRSVPDQLILASVCAAENMENAASCIEQAIQEAAKPEQDNYTYILIGVPVGFFTAVFLSKVAGKKVRSAMETAVSLLAGIPSVVYGLVGMLVLVPAVRSIFHVPDGASLLAAIIVLAIMILPSIIKVSVTALDAVPKEYEDASLALGASPVETFFRVSVPAAKSGIAAAVVLGVGRAIGEAMAVMMVAGNVANMPSLFQSVRFLTTAVASEMSYSSPGSLQRNALFSIALVLFLFIMLLNAALNFFLKRDKEN